MIAIVNISGDDLKQFGENTYSVRINHKEIVQFKHQRQDGLAECLRKAAQAVDEEKTRRTVSDLMSLHKEGF